MLVLFFFLLAWFGTLRLFARLLGTVETVGTFWEISAWLVRDMGQRVFSMPEEILCYSALEKD
jgi:hypothetical protein